MKTNLSLVMHTIVYIGVIGLYGLHFSDQQKVVYVDSKKLLNEYLGMQEAKKAYEKKLLQWQSNIDTLTKELQLVIENHKMEIDQMSEKEKSLSEELIKTKRNGLKSYTKAISEKAQQEDIQLTNQTIDQVNEFLQQYGKTKKYQIILAATDFGNLAYAADGLDVTEDVLNALNNQYLGVR